MFTGIIEEIGTIRSAGPTRLTITASVVTEDLKLGDSVAVDGTCLTAVATGRNEVTLDVMPETHRRTTLGGLRPGDAVNLERAIAPGQRMGGHFVQGHVDATGRIMSRRSEGNAIVVLIAAPPEVMRYVVEKAFIAVDGASLTVVSVQPDTFAVSLVPFTRSHTTLTQKREGALVNLEVDIIAKYVENSLRARTGGISAEFLAEHGF